MSIINQTSSSNPVTHTKTCTDEVIADLDIYVRHYHASRGSAFQIHDQTPEALVGAAKRLYQRGILSSLEDAQLTRQGFEIVRQVCQSLACHAGK